MHVPAYLSWLEKFNKMSDVNTAWKMSATVFNCWQWNQEICKQKNLSRPFHLTAKFNDCPRPFMYICSSTMHNNVDKIQSYGLSVPEVKLQLLLTAMDEEGHEGRCICFNSCKQLQYVVCTSGECIRAWLASTLPYTHRSTAGEWSTIETWKVRSGRQTENVPHMV